MGQKEKIILVTGSTDGIGLEVIRNLSEKGHVLILHGRHMSRVNKVLNSFENGIKKFQISGFKADLSSLEEVRKMAESLLLSFERIDVLINNAGVIMKKFELSENGYEKTFAINHLGHFYLTGLLLPLLTGNHGSRIINVSSGVHSSSIDLDKLNRPEYFESVEAYSDSKLCNILFSYKLSKILKGRDVMVNAMHPGVLNTKMLKETWGPVGSPIIRGARNEIYVATSSELSGVTGVYFNEQRMTQSADTSYGSDLQDRLWEYSVKLVREAGFDNPYEQYG